jgi:succinoglycan biosynthesis transport protein ExoP
VSQIDSSQQNPAIGLESSPSVSFGERLDFIVAFLRRRYLTILSSFLLALPLGALYYYTTVPQYTATVTMMIESRKSFLQESLMGSSPLDTAWIESQIGILKSASVAAYIVKQLRLADDPQFVRPPAGGLDKLLARLGGGNPEPGSEAERVNAAIGQVMGGLDVKRLGQSYMMRIDYRSHNPEQASKIANTVVDGYIFDQLNAKYQANRRSSDWLQERLQALREQAATAERAVLEFKTKNNIVPATNGTLMNEKQLTELTGQVAAARNQVSELQSRIDRIATVREAYQQDRPVSGQDENVSEAMSNPVIGRFRNQYLDLVNRESDWSARYGKNHSAVVNLRNQIRDIRKSIRDELGRIEETHKSERGLALKRQAEFEKQLASLITQSSETNQAQVALFSLEAAAQSYRKLYDSFLQRHTESVQQQTFPVSDARTISPASAIKTSPRMLQISLVTIFAGAALGVGLGVFREIMDRGFRTRDQVRAVLGTECLALVPLLVDQRRGFFNGGRSLPSRHQPLLIEHQATARSIRSAPKIMRAIVDSPSSPYAEAIRTIKLTADLNGLNRNKLYNKVLGLTSCLPSEGKSTLAAAMATLIAQDGSRVILLDCDFRHPSLSRALAPDASCGFIDVIEGKLNLADAIWTDATTNMAFLPAGVSSSGLHPSDILAAHAARSLFASLQVKYDYIIVDLPPLVAGADVRAAAPLINSYVLVIEWGATKADAVQYALRHAPGVHANILGAVLNKVDMAAMGKYDGYGARYYDGAYRQAGMMH